MIIGICGFARVGKSTAGQHLSKAHGFTQHNFKDGLIAEIKERFPHLLRELSQAYHMDEDKLFINKPPAMRALLQNYGTEVRRKDNPNYWVDRWQEAMPDGNVVVDDVRFFNELDKITESGGVLIRIVRPDVTTGGDHQSEVEQTKFSEDFTVSVEPGAHDQLSKQLDKIISELKSNAD